MPPATYLSWIASALTLTIAAIWYLRRGMDATLSARRSAMWWVGASFALIGFINSVWLGVLRNGSWAAMVPYGWATALVSCVISFGMGVLLAAVGSMLLSRLRK